MLFTSGMLDVQQLNTLPKTTKYNWNNFKHENYFGHEMATDYIKQFDAIKEVFASKYTFRALRLLLKTRRGYYQILQDIQGKKKLLKNNADSIVLAVDQMVESSNINKVAACKLYGISKDWYYVQKQKIICELSPFKRCYKRHSNQLSRSEVQIIEDLVIRQGNYGKTKTTLYYQAMRDNLITCGQSTFNKYANALGYTKVRRFKTLSKKKF